MPTGPEQALNEPGLPIQVRFLTTPTGTGVPVFRYREQTKATSQKDGGVQALTIMQSASLMLRKR